jgi:hypothetical protein
MATRPCEHCGHQAEGAVFFCPACGQTLTKGFFRPLKGPVQKPPPPPEAANWIIYQAPPEVLEEFRKNFDEEAFLAELREWEQNGSGRELKDFIAELEQEFNSRD